MFASSFLIAVNFLVYFLEYYIYNARNFSAMFGLNELFFSGFWWQIITSMFLHASITHILMNMIVLYQFGSILERYLGSIKFFILYFIGGILTSLLSLSYLFFSQVNLVGASGAICVLLGYMAYVDQYNRKGLLIAVLVMSFAPLFLGLNIAWYAHLFGFGIGYLVGYLKIIK